ncbi:MAG TPA: sigma-70 family RNA polymerase sigma factor [Lentimicrobium sp.]|nr:sigma-70 family RNA polymerase sigma factor [Lentimicrobium sp.]
MTTKINKSQLFKKAWQLFNSQPVRTDEMFSECLKSAWAIFKSTPSISALYKKYYSDVFRYVSFRMNNIDEVGEIVNDTFLKVNEKMHLFNASKSNLKTWIINIAKNSMIDFMRKAERSQTVNVSDFQDENGKEVFQYVSDNEASTVVENSELSAKINKALDSLKPNYKRIAVLYFVEDKSYQEISEEMNMPLGSVKGTINRVRTMLQSELQTTYASL